MNCNEFIIYAFQDAKTKGFKVCAQVTIKHIDNNDFFQLTLALGDNDELVCFNDVKILKIGAKECVEFLSIFNITNITYSVSNGQFGTVRSYEDRDDFHLDFKSDEFGRCFWVEISTLTREVQDHDWARLTNNINYDYPSP